MRSGSLPAAAQRHCEAMFIRMNSPLGVAVFAPNLLCLNKLLNLSVFAEQNTVMLQADESECPIFADLKFELYQENHQDPKFVQSWANGDLVLSLVVPETNLEGALAFWEQDHTVDASRRVLWADNVSETANFAFTVHRSDTAKLRSWIKNFLASGIQADCDRAQMFLAKYPVNDHPSKRSTVSDTLFDNDPMKSTDPNDLPSLFAACAKALADIQTRAPLGQPLHEDILQAQDQIVLLELEGTEDAAATALSMLLQLRREIVASSIKNAA